jgi:alcohol dehydrogenase class IV
VIGFFTAPRYVFGPGAIEQLSALETTRPVVVVDPRLKDSLPVRRVLEELAKREVAATTFVVPDGPPTVAGAEGLAVGFRDRGADWIVAVGGGRTLDVARAGWLRFERPELSLADVSPLIELGLRQKAGFVAIPSTSGSGAESTGALRLVAEDGTLLRPTSRELVPDWALLEPALAASMPPKVTADSGAQALAHAVESLVSAWSNPFSEALGREAFAALLRSLPKVARAPDDLELRGQIHHASSMAGLAAANSQDGATAALSEALAPGIGLSYGRCMGILLPYILEFNYPAARETYQSLGPLLGEGSIAHRSDLARRVRGVTDALGIPRTLADAGVAEERLRSVSELVATRAGQSGAALSNPRVPSRSEWGQLLDAAYRGTAIAF